LLAFSAAALVAAATETKFWTQDDYSEFEKGNLKNVSLASDGRLLLAPAFREVFDTQSVYLWTVVQDSKGNVYAGGGGPGGPGARVYVISPGGKGRTFAEMDDLEVHALAVDRKDRVYAATYPDGKVYRISGAGKPEVFFDPHAKYIWAMAFDSRGELFVATGEHGEVYRVSPDGKGSLFYKTPETHARSLAVDAKDNLILGTEPGGLVIRVSPKGEGFVLYQAPKREITAVAVAKDGAIYAAGVGNKQPAGLGPVLGPPPSMPPAPSASAHGMTPGAPAAAPAPRPATPAPVTAPTVSGGSEVYRIDTEGFPHRVWSHSQNIAYTIGFDPEGRPLVGSGNKGTIYRIDSDLVYTELLNAPPTQVTCIYGGRDGKLYAATGNVGKVYQIGPGVEKEGTLESDVFDAGIFSRWGRLAFRGQPNGGQIVFSTRSGNLDRPENDWSPWAGSIDAPDGARVESPSARFLQWKLTLRASGAGNSPEVTSVDVAYLPRNVAPAIEQVEITPANYRFPPQATLPMTNPPNINLPPIGRRTRPTPAASVSSDTTSMQYAKGWIGARWAASDENGDTLVYTVEIKGEKETDWKLLKAEVNDRHLSWDSSAFPDGEYRVRITASDEPGNTAGQALATKLVSDPFLIDNTAPAISGLSAAVSGNQIVVKFKAVDGQSVIDKAEVSVNGGEWTLVEPVGKLSDWREASYDFTLPRTSQGEQTVAVRVADEYDNQSVAKAVVR
jgi:sugar lactone lactonase YvrE